MAVNLALRTSFLFTPTAGLSAPAFAPVEKPPDKIYAQILFIGDIMLDRGIRYYAEKNGGNNFIFEKIHENLLDYDLVVANLEGPITDNKSISITAKLESPESYFFTFNPSWAETLSINNIRLVNLGNNHILNFGSEGLQSTKKYLSEAGVDYFGSSDYPKNMTSEINGVKITFINYNEFSAYGEIEGEATVEEIKKAKGFSDIIVVYSHWGAEYIPEPADSIKELAHQFVDAGADLVVGSHPHVIQAIETYNGKRIYYSLGNFVFDQYFSEETKTGLGVVMEVDSVTKELNFEEIDFYLQPNGQTVLAD